eukprot:gene16436-22409_t
MKPSIEEAANHFATILPKRIRDKLAENEHFERTKKRVKIYRKANQQEEKAELYPVTKAGLSTFSHFGVGIGIYFFQLLALATVGLVCGAILIMSIYAYSRDTYGIKSGRSPLIKISGACYISQEITVTEGCDENETSCVTNYISNCELPVLAVYADLIMCLIFLMSLFAARLIESKIEEQLDDYLQTAPDYSVVVEDPEDDADDIYKWFKYFRQFGVVRYITITRKNKSLCALIHEKHNLVRNMKSQSKTTSSITKQLELKNKLSKLEKKLQIAYNQPYPVCKVYVTFETEVDKVGCLRALEVPDIVAMFDLKHGFNLSNTNSTNNNHQPKDPLLFDGTNILNVKVPPEPDDILWENVESSWSNKLFFRLVSYFVTAVLLTATYFILNASRKFSTILLSLVIGGLDNVLPIIFLWFTDLSSPQSEGERQKLLQQKLFFARITLTAVIPYIQINWNEFLLVSTINQMISVQFTSSFTAPILNYLDLTGSFTRHVYAPLFTSTQEKMNSLWSGSDWSLAERYTSVSKIIFITLIYALITPISLLISVLAFIVVFVVDRYLLLRKWKPTALINSQIAKSVHDQALLALAAHMYVSLRFIYSWPMDSAYEYDKSLHLFKKVDKFPSYRVWTLTGQEWHTEQQKQILPIYLICAYGIAIITIGKWIILPFISWLKDLFLTESFEDEVSDSEPQSFSKIAKILSYVPITTGPGNEKFILCNTKDMMPNNRPTLLRYSIHERDDLSYYIPEKYHHKVLSIVKYFDDEENDDISTEKVVIPFGFWEKSFKYFKNEILKSRSKSIDVDHQYELPSFHNNINNNRQNSRKNQYVLFNEHINDNNSMSKSNDEEIRFGPIRQKSKDRKFNDKFSSIDEESSQNDDYTNDEKKDHDITSKSILMIPNLPPA